MYSRSRVENPECLLFDFMDQCCGIVTSIFIFREAPSRVFGQTSIIQYLCVNNPTRSQCQVQREELSLRLMVERGTAGEFVRQEWVRLE